MNSRGRFFDLGDDLPDSNHDRTLRVLEGRAENDVLHSAPPFSSRFDSTDNDDTGDVFLKIAREEASRRQSGDCSPEDTQSTVVSDMSPTPVRISCFHVTRYLSLDRAHGVGCTRNL